MQGILNCFNAISPMPQPGIGHLDPAWVGETHVLVFTSRLHIDHATRAQTQIM